MLIIKLCNSVYYLELCIEKLIIVHFKLVMKFETQSGCKLLSISLCDEREGTLSLQQKLWRHDQDQARRHVRSDKEADWPSEKATAMLCGRSVFTPVVYS